MLKEHRDKFDEYHAYMTEANRMRGEIINNCIHMERWLDVLLAFHFCESNEIKRESFLKSFMISGHVTLKNKVNVFKKIIPFLPKSEHQYFEDAVKDILNRIIPARNALAHRSLEQIDLKESYKEKKTVYKDEYSEVSFEMDNWNFAKILQATSDYTGRFMGQVGWMEFMYAQPPINPTDESAV